MKRIKDKKGHYAFIVPLPFISPHIKFNSVPDFCEFSLAPQHYWLCPCTETMESLIKTIVFMNN